MGIGKNQLSDGMVPNTLCGLASVNQRWALIIRNVPVDITDSGLKPYCHLMANR